MSREAGPRPRGVLSPGELPTARRSPQAVRFMGAWFERFFRRHLNGLRLARWGEPAWSGDGPLVVYSNHPGWWDAAVYALLARKRFGSFECYGPINAAMLAKYGFFARVGAFGVELDTRRGAAAFLQASADILSRPDRVLLITAQGRFADPRERPLGLRAGIARLVELAPAAQFLPLAIEYAFWTERGAEALAAFGPAIPGHELAPLARADRLEHLEAALERTMGRLAEDVVAREPGRFRPALEGKAGIGGVYDGWRRLRALLQGRRFDPAHRGEPTG